MSDEYDNDGGVDMASHEDIEFPLYTDFVAQRTAAFSALAIQVAKIENDAARDLALTMLRTVIRSVRTPPDATLSEIGR